MSDEFNEKVLKAVKLIEGSKKTFALTGAGISTESGIPDFRSNTGYYSKMDPVSALSKETLLKNPEKFYNEGFKILEDLHDKNPNKAHFVLAELEKMKLLNGIITQNIDSLHTKAGSKKVYEVHGETKNIHCIDCNRKFPFEIMKSKIEKKEIPPICDCGGILRPNVVMFGDMMPNDFEMALKDLNGTNLLIVIGSSLTVSPVNLLPRYSDKLIIINKEKTPLDSFADVVFNSKASEVLEEIVKKLKEIN